MALSTLGILRVGIEPSSSHTTGAMRAARSFSENLVRSARFDALDRINVELHGSRALAARGSTTDRAIALGQSGCVPEGVRSDISHTLLEEATLTKRLSLLGVYPIAFDPAENLRFIGDRMLLSNWMWFRAPDPVGRPSWKNTFIRSVEVSSFRASRARAFGSRRSCHTRSNPPKSSCIDT